MIIFVDAENLSLPVVYCVFQLVISILKKVTIPADEIRHLFELGGHRDWLDVVRNLTWIRSDDASLWKLAR